MNFNNQNWDYVSFTSKKGTQNHGSEKLVTKSLAEGRDVETVKKTTATNKNNQVQNIGKLVEAEEFKVDTVSHDFKIALQQARQAKNMTQVQLAQAINEKQTVISEYESGKAIPNPQVISKLERALGCRLPRQKKKKDKKGGDDD